MTSQGQVVRGSVQGVPIDALSQTEILDQFLTWTGSPVPHVAVGINANVCTMAARNATFRDHIRAADLAYADGQSIVWAARALGIPVPERAATTDLIVPLARECAVRGKRMFLYGSAPGIAEAAAERLREQAPGLQVESSDGYVPADRMAELVERIRNYRAHILLVGLGDPLQQAWIAAHRDELAVPVILSCGGLFDWTSGSHRRSPQWMISAGLEWLWRLLIEPRRLARRYLIDGPIFVGRFALEVIRVRVLRRPRMFWKP